MCILLSLSLFFSLLPPLCVCVFDWRIGMEWGRTDADVEINQFKEDSDQSGSCGRRSQSPTGRRSSRQRVNRAPLGSSACPSVNRLYVGGLVENRSRWPEDIEKGASSHRCWGTFISAGEPQYGFFDIHAQCNFSYHICILYIGLFDIHTIFFLHMYFSRRHHATLNSCREAVIYPSLQSESHIPASQLQRKETQNPKSQRASKPFKTLPLESQSPSASPTPPNPHQHRYPSAQSPRSYR